jgi:hypothetical protein
MAQANKPSNVKKLAARVGVLVAAAFCVNLLLSPATETQLDASALSAITTDATFKTTLGNGSRAIHVFLSTECPFCRQIEHELDPARQRHRVQAHASWHHRVKPPLGRERPVCGVRPIE